MSASASAQSSTSTSSHSEDEVLNQVEARVTALEEQMVKVHKDTTRRLKVSIKCNKKIKERVLQDQASIVILTLRIKSLEHQLRIQNLNQQEQHLAPLIQ
jgi:hypothetical protein